MVSGVEVSYSTDRGSSFSTAARNLAKSGTFSLVVPSDVSGSFLIRVNARDGSGNEGSATRTCRVRSSYPAVALGATSMLTPTPTPTPTGSSEPVPLPSFAGESGEPTVSILAPDPYRIVTPGSEIDLAWTSSDSGGIAGIEIRLSCDRGASWTILARDAEPAGRIPVRVPEGMKGTLMLRVTAEDSDGNTASALRSCIVRQTSAAQG